VDAFEEFTEVAARSFGDRVKQWTTMNEPFCSAFLGYELGVHAPGMKDLSLAVKASHHLLLVHGAAVSVLHSRLPGSKVGNVLNTSPFYPYTQSVQDRDAARHGDGRLTRWFLDPPYNRQYPLDILDDYVKEGGLSSTTPEFIQDGDMEKIAVPTDFLVPITTTAQSTILTMPEHKTLLIVKTKERTWDGKYSPLDCTNFWSGFISPTSRLKS
jgi:beta-glucosidase